MTDIQYYSEGGYTHFKKVNVYLRPLQPTLVLVLFLLSAVILGWCIFKDEQLSTVNIHCF